MHAYSITCHIANYYTNIEISNNQTACLNIKNK